MTLADKFSQRAQQMRGSEIRRLFKISMRPGVISFAGGLPDPGSFPAEEVARVSGQLLRDQGERMLQYGPARGLDVLIQAVAQKMAARGISVTPEEILITSGAQQALDLAGKVLLDPDDIVLVENPSFIGALGAFRNYGCKLVGVAMDDDGLDTDALVAVLEGVREQAAPVKFLYTIPNFHNPAGLTLTQTRRDRLVDIAREYDLLILEDDAYGELWFEGGLESTKPVKARDKDERVMYAGSFSKLVSPGIRLGWLAASGEIIDKCEMAKQMMDVCPSPLTQAVVAELWNSGFLDRHVEDLRGVYKSRRDAMLSALEAHMPRGVEWTRPHGGFYVWITLPSGVDARALLDIALDNQVAYVIGSAFFADDSGQNTLRVSFCHETEEVIQEGIARLGRAFQDAFG